MRWIVVLVCVAACASPDLLDENELLQARSAELEGRLAQAQRRLDAYRDKDGFLAWPRHVPHWTPPTMELGAATSVREENGMLRDRIAGFREQLSRVFRALDVNRMGGGLRRRLPLVIGDEARILEVRGNLVALSVGRDDGVSNGDSYNVRRGARYIGSVTVTRALRGQSVAEFDARDASRPQSGDVAFPAR